MKIIENADLVRIIPIEYFNVCLLDNKTREEISKMFTKTEVTKHKSCYYLDKFNHYLKTIHNLDMKEYCKKYLENEWPRCPINNEEVGFKLNGKGIMLSRFVSTVTKEYSPKFKEACERFSIERKGDGNPMYGKDSWNKGLTKETNEILREMGERGKGRKQSEAQKEKNRQHMLRRLANGEVLHNTPHSEETKEFLRRNTAALWARGVFNRVTSIHIKMREFLQTLDLIENPVEEYQIKYFSSDFAFPEHKIAIECQGQYYHVDPRVYPNGPKTAVQRRNFGRDKAKKKYLDMKGWIMLEAWEAEINDGSFKEDILCKLKELKLLKS